MSLLLTADGDPGAIADAQEEVERFVPADILRRYTVYSYRHAAALLATCAAAEFDEICQALRQFRLTRQMILTSGGNESEIPKAMSDLLRPLGWYETSIRGEMHVFVDVHDGAKKAASDGTPLVVQEVLNGHKVDYVKNRVAFDLEWNSKDQTFDRDLNAARAFYDYGVISAAVLLTRSKDLDPIFDELKVKGKYGASTTWMGKLLSRLRTGRQGGCPVLAFGITRHVVEDDRPEPEPERSV